MNSQYMVPVPSICSSLISICHIMQGDTRDDTWAVKVLGGDRNGGRQKEAYSRCVQALPHRVAISTALSVIACSLHFTDMGEKQKVLSGFCRCRCVHGSMDALNRLSGEYEKE